MDLMLILLQAATDLAPIAKMGAGFSAAIVSVAAAFGIGTIGRYSVESIARQPEAAGDIRSNMIISAALIEGVAFFAIVICLLILFV
ncbi:MAG: ATP synthase F0 subunit C [Bacteroidales bacterium]|jgi:F-type H+-transporting ATPase subunit c